MLLKEKFAMEAPVEGHSVPEVCSTAVEKGVKASGDESPPRDRKILHPLIAHIPSNTVCNGSEHFAAAPAA